MSSQAFIQERFREYYERDFSLDNSFWMIEKREFGFILFKEGMLRHKKFEDKNGLEAFLRSFVPSDVYYSCAYYEDPEDEMEKKGWLGADLIFDIDADHITTSCSKVHDEWTCGNCGFAGKGIKPEKCPVCGGEKFEVSTWPCENCLASAKAETLKLLDMLMQDFGFSEKEIRVFFSGHRGYHIHVESEAVKSLDAVARKEIVDYVCGLGFDSALQGFSGKNSYVFETLNLKAPGWLGRTARCVYDFLLHAELEDYRSAGVKGNVAKAIIRNKDTILRNLSTMGSYGIVKGVGFETLRKIAEFCAKLQSTQVDTVVTTDVHRLIRLANTLHGKTGLKKVEFPISKLEDFDPFKSAAAFKKGNATVFVSDAPKFKLGDEIFGPYKNQKVELPTAAAVLLVCKGRAEVVE
ncbi:MAG: DNA primase small subunit domain-containing protein [Candidatus Bathycorpusculaceae bacterium]